MRNTRPPRPPEFPPRAPALDPASGMAVLEEFRAAWSKLVQSIHDALVDLGRAILRPWRQFQQWRCGRAWDRYWRTDPLVLLQNAEAEANLELWEADSEFARELAVAPTFRGRSGRIVVGLEWDSYPGDPSIVRAHYIFADGEEDHGPWDLATAISIYKAELWS